MGLGDLLGDAKDWAVRLGEAASATNPLNAGENAARAAAQDPNFLRQQAEHPSFFGAAAGGATAAVSAYGNVVGTAIQPASHLPGWDQFMTAVDAGRRAADTLIISSQHAGAVSEKAGGADSVAWGELLNKDNWARAWDESSYDNTGRVTGGNVLSARAFGHNDRIETADPFAAADAKAIQQAANGTWYGQTTSALVDLGTSFIAPPGTGTAVRALKAAREAKVVSSAAEAEKAALRFNDAGLVKDGKVTAGEKAKDTFDLLWHGDQNVDSVLHRQMVGLRQLDGIKDQSRMLDTLKSRLENAADGALANIADVFTEINKVPDATMRDKLRMNYFLAAHGSSTARKAFIEDAPLIARNFEQLTSTPREAGAVAELYATRLGHGAEDLPINELIDNHYGTAADKAEQQALLDSLEGKIAEARDAKALWQETRAGKPTIKNIDADLLKRSRQDSINNVQRLKAELSKAQDDLRGTKRWASGAVKRGELGDVADFHVALGDARARVTELESRLGQARSDRDLLHQTPLPGSVELQAFKEDVAAARGLSKEADANRNWTEAYARTHRDTMRAKEQEIAALRPTLNRANDVLNDILDVAGENASVTITGGMEPTLLSALKKNVTDRIGADHYVFHGDGNTITRVRSLPGRSARMALAPQARGSISLNEVSLGQRQLGDTLARSGAFTPAEIVEAQNTLIRVKGHARAGVVASYQTKMLERMAVDFFKKRGIDLSPEDALRKAKEVTSVAEKAWGRGNAWVSRAADEQATNKLISVRDIDGPAVAFDQPMLRSHLADNAPILDPWDFGKALEKFEPTIRQNLALNLHAATNLHDMALQFWKVGALLRPGLMVRSMLDTGPRMLASLSAAESMIAGMTGAANLIHNKALTGLSKIHFSGLTPDEAAAKARFLGLKPVEVNVGGRKVTHQFAADVADLQTKLEASSKGQTVHGALFHDMTKAYDGLKVDRAKWSRRKADSELWHVAYKEYAGLLLASPTARKLADMMSVRHAGESLDDIRRSIKDSPEFKAEYTKFAQPMGRTREEFLSHVAHEVELMFPSESLLSAAKSGGLSKKFLDREMPSTARFDIPSPEMSAYEGIDAWNRVKGATDKAFRLLLDKPDMWLARNPTAVMLYNRAIKKEYDDLARKFGPDHEVTPEMMKSIDARARGQAIGYVRRTFFDTTRNTGAHRYAARISPFFMAWEDAMMSWGRLITDDPRRIVKLSAAYHAPYTIADATGNGLVTDQNGQPIGRRDNPDGVFVNVPQWAFKPLLKAASPLAKAVGLPLNPDGVPRYNVRLDAINSIFQGETWWLPGVGPTVTVPVTYALGTDKVISREAALDIVDTDNWFGKQVLKSMYLGGEIPPADKATLASSVTPGWVRNLFTEAMGTGKIRNRQTTFNYLVGQAMANGETLNSETYSKLWERADKTANAAAITRLIAGGGLGLTGSATVDGQFYADQYHIIQGMTPEMRDGLSADEFFAQKYPEAADLDWSITKNETGIVASVNAAKAESKLGGLLGEAKRSGAGDIGWMILGRDNMVDTQFSRTAYNIQRTEGSRTYQSSNEAMAESQAAVGWRQYNAWNQQVLDMASQFGLDENSDQYKAAKRAIGDYLKQSNPAWAKAFSERTDRFGYLYSQAQRLSTSKTLKDRSDMVAFRDYDTARQQVMQQFGIKSLSGSKPEYVAARTVLKQAGETLGKKDLGFQQMWDRFLSSEVEEG